MVLVLGAPVMASEWQTYGGFPYVPEYGNGSAQGIGVFQNPLVDLAGNPIRWALMGSIKSWVGCTDPKYYRRATSASSTPAPSRRAP